MAEDQSREYYSRRAPEYERIYFRDVPERRKEIDDEVVYLRDLAAGKDVLELACGTGYWTKVMAETANSIVAMDLSFEMIAQSRLKEYVSPPFFVQGDLTRIPAADRAFDLVVLGFWFSHQSKQEYEPFFDRISRPLRAGGRIWLIDNNPPAEGPTSDSAGIDEYGNNYKQRVLESGDEFVILKNYFERAELETIFGGRFEIERLLHNRYYWSIVLRCK